MDEIKSAEIEFQHYSILVARIQTTAGEDRHKDHGDRGTLYRIFDLRLESRCDSVTFDNECNPSSTRQPG